MNPGEIGEQAGVIFNYFKPSNWIFRSQEDQNDHGIDGEIEIKDESGRALGQDHVFKLQIKGQSPCRYNKDERFASVSLDRERVGYYLGFQIPVILILVDIDNERVFWLPLTGNKEILDKYINSSANEISVRVRARNELLKKDLDTFDFLLDDVSSCWLHIKLSGIKNAVNGVPPEIFQETKDELGSAYFSMHLKELDDLWAAGECYKAYNESVSLSGNPIFSFGDRYNAAFFSYKSLRLFSPYKKDIDNFNAKFFSLDQMVNISRRLRSFQHRVLAIGLCRVTVFEGKAIELANLHQIKKLNKNTLIHPLIFNESFSNLASNLEKIVLSCNRLIRFSDPVFAVELFKDAAFSIVVFRSFFHEMGHPESVIFLDSWFDSFFDYCIKFYMRNGDYESPKALYVALKSEKPIRHELCENYKDLLLSVDPNIKEYLDTVDIYIEASSKAKVLDLDVESQKRYFISLAKSLGMDPDDPSSDLGRAVRLALDNYDPTLILKDCSHLAINYRPAGIVHEYLGMHSAGGLHMFGCIKHGYASGSGSLARAYSGSPHCFKDEHCSECPDKCPRDKDWQWSLNWQIRQEELNHEFFSKFRL